MAKTQRRRAVSFKRWSEISARLLVALPAEMREIIAGRRDYRVSPSGVSWGVKQLRRFIKERPRTIKVEAVVSVGTVDGPQLNESEADSALPVVVVEGLAIGIPRTTCTCVLPNAATGIAIEVRHDAHVATLQLTESVTSLSAPFLLAASTSW